MRRRQEKQKKEGGGDKIGKYEEEVKMKMEK